MVGRYKYWGLLPVLLLGIVFSGCSGEAITGAITEVATPAAEEHDDHRTDMEVLALPDITAVALSDRPLNVVATTSIIGDVVAQVGGQAISLTTLIGPGQDPHSYQPGARQLTAVANADVIFVNGWDLEEALVHHLESIGEQAILVPVSANVEPLAFGEMASGERASGERASEERAHDDADEDQGEHGHNGADPHVWQAVSNVEQWVNNIQQVLSALDPENTAVYERNAAAYLEALAELEAYAQSQLATIPSNKRVLITNHDALAYFAHAYNFEILGAVIPGGSSLTETSATGLASLVNTMKAHGVCTIFTENTGNSALATAVAAELKECEGGVQLIELYTDALGPAGSSTDSYIGMFRTNLDAIVAGLR